MTFKEMLDELLRAKIVLVPNNARRCFVKYCETKGVTPCGGAFVGFTAQYFYI